MPGPDHHLLSRASGHRPLPQPVDRAAVANQAGVAGDDVDHVQFPFSLDAMRAARRISTSFRGAAVTAAMMRSQVSHRT